MPETLLKLYQELHAASRELYRYRGIDFERAAKAMTRLDEVSYAITLYLERDQEDETSTPHHH